MFEGVGPYELHTNMLCPLLRIVLLYHTACEGHRRSLLELAEDEEQEPFILHSESWEPGQRLLT